MLLVNDPLILIWHCKTWCLFASPQVRQATYRALFDTHVDEHSLSAIRESLNQCRVLGSEIFKDQIEHALARRVRPGKSGRPKRISV